MLVKGNVVKGNNSERHAMVLAVRKDGKAARLYVYGPDTDMWMPVNRFTVVTAGLETCYKCGGSGIYYMGGAVVNGRYTGKTGVCFGCEGKGKQDDADRLRCHYYWHRQAEIDDRIEAAERGDTANTVENKPLSTPLTRPLERNPVEPQMNTGEIVKKPSKRKNHPDPDRKRQHTVTLAEKHDALIDCRDCGCVHRDDVDCPW